MVERLGPPAAFHSFINVINMACSTPFMALRRWWFTASCCFRLFQRLASVFLISFSASQGARVQSTSKRHERRTCGYTVVPEVGVEKCATEIPDIDATRLVAAENPLENNMARNSQGTPVEPREAYKSYPGRLFSAMVLVPVSPAFGACGEALVTFPVHFLIGRTEHASLFSSRSFYH